MWELSLFTFWGPQPPLVEHLDPLLTTYVGYVDTEHFSTANSLVWGLLRLAPINCIINGIT